MLFEPNTVTVTLTLNLTLTLQFDLIIAYGPANSNSKCLACMVTGSTTPVNMNVVQGCLKSTFDQILQLHGSRRGLKNRA